MPDERYVPPFPEHPQLREIAEAIERYGCVGEIFDASFRNVYFSSAAVAVMRLSVDEAESFHGMSIIRRNVDGVAADIVRPSEESAAAWTQHNFPIIRGHLKPGDPEFEEVFGPFASVAPRFDPVETPGAWHDTVSFSEDVRFRRYVLGDAHQIHIRINDDHGRFIGTVLLSRPTLPEPIIARLARGDQGLFERMDRVSEPGRRPAGILFADLEASGALSRRLSSRGYFGLVRDLTDLIDSSVIASTGIVGKHAGDGGSALFLVEDFEGMESGAARATVEAARLIRDGAADLGPDDVNPKINVGVHWGATLMVGQVATRGRLEVTALGDQMNEGARIEHAAKDGTILASKDLLERLEPDDAQAVGIDPDAIAYRPLAELADVSEKAVRDAGSIAVTTI